MIGILKALKSNASVDNNTKAFNVLLAFSGGVWCSLSRQLLYATLNLILSTSASAVCYSLVHLWKASTRPRSTSRILSRDDWIQTDVCCLARVFAFKANVLVSRFFLSHVSRCSYGRYEGVNALFFCRGDVLNTTVWVLDGLKPVGQAQPHVGLLLQLSRTGWFIGVPGFLTDNITPIQRRILLNVAAYPSAPGWHYHTSVGSVVSRLETYLGKSKGHIQPILACSENV